MNYNKPELISALAAEYVLGTLDGKARVRFERLKFNNEAIQKEIDYWEANLNTLSLNLTAVQPSSSVYANIKAKIGLDSLVEENTPTVNDNSGVLKAGTGAKAEVIDIGKNSANRSWKWMSGLAIAASLVLSVVLFNNFTSRDYDPVISIAVISNEDSQTLWSFDVLKDDIAIKTTRFVPRLANNDYQLWIVPASGEAPISIGVMQQTEQFRLAKPSMFDQIEIAALAVSQEPLGGSPTGAPTKVLFATELATL